MNLQSLGRVTLTHEEARGFEGFARACLRNRTRRNLNALARLAFRGWMIVALTALNVTQIAAHHYGSAFLVGTAISFVWFGNSRQAAHSDVRGARWAYALGAGLGTITGMYLGSWG